VLLTSQRYDITVQIGMLGTAKDAETKKNIIGSLFSEYTLEQLGTVIEEMKNGWIGNVGGGARILARIIAQF